MTSQLASCPSSFSWMDNGIGQDPCTIAAWLIALCVDPTSNSPASVAPIGNGQTSYLPPNGTSATACTCSWAFYNTIEACTVCQDFTAQEWAFSCNVLGQTSTSTYWQSSTSFSSRTRLPRWSILNPSKWDSGTFNEAQAEEIANQNASASQPTVSSPSTSPSSSSESTSAGKKKTNVGAIAGGVVAGVLVLLVAGITLWFFLVKQRGRSNGRRRGPREHVDLDAEPDGDFLARSSSLMEQSGNPLAAHLRSQSLSYSATSPISPTSPMSYNPTSQHQQQMMSQGYPVRSQTFPPPAMAGNHPVLRQQGQGPTNVVVGITHSTPRRTSRESIPTVAEQLDEKKRIRAEQQQQQQQQQQQRQRRNPSTGFASVVTRTATSSRSNSLDDFNSGSQTLSNNNSSTAVAISHAISRSLSHSGTGSPNGNTSPSLADPDKSASHTKHPRRLSLKNPPWIKRRTVMNLDPDADLGSDDGDLPANVAPLPLGGTVAAAGQTTTPCDVIAAVPGARLPNARERENPPPEYMSASS
ncbi:hypothetical protein ACEPAH_83 [Sanghuangporus vaninii]